MNLDRELRPSNLDEVVGLKNIKEDLRNYIKTLDPPHMIFIGPPGVGKNTVAYAYASEYLQRKINIDTENNSPMYMEINGSKYTGIDTVKDDITDFAGASSGEYRNGVLIKRILFLNEFEKMSNVAKAALKDDMEKFEKWCIFILATNYEESIKEDALKSRCAIFRFKRPKETEIAEWLIEVAGKNGIKFESEELVYAIIDYYGGDMRAILIDCLEALRGYDDEVKKLIKEEYLWKIFGESTVSYAQQVYNSKDRKETFMKLWRSNNFNVRNFLEDYFKINELKYPKLFAKIDSRLRRGCSEMIQMSLLFDAISDG